MCFSGVAFPQLWWFAAGLLLGLGAGGQIPSRGPGGRAGGGRSRAPGRNLWRRGSKPAFCKG